MNVIVLDQDKEFLQEIAQSFIEIDFNYFLFENIESLRDWVDTDSGTHIHFLLIGITSECDDGFVKSATIQEWLKPHSTPAIIFLLAEANDVHSIKSVKYGNGHLLKPFSTDLLLYTLHYHDKYNQLNVLLSRQNRKLLEYQQRTEQESTIVQSIFDNHCKNHLSTDESVKFYISPASVFNGDVLLSTVGPTGSIYVAVGDVTGHGLPAAIGAMPTYSIFRAMAEKGLSVGAIAAEMNRVLRTLLPDNMMVALTLMEMNFANSQAMIWSGGMPDVIVRNKKGDVTVKLQARHSPLTVLDQDQFRRDIDVVSLTEGDQLYFYTDGVEEAHNSSGEIFGTERLLSLFQSRTRAVFNDIIEAHHQFTLGTEQNDDITLVEVTFSECLDVSSEDIPNTNPAATAIPWTMNFTLNASTLCRCDPVVQIVNFMDNAIGLDVHQDGLSTIIAELFNNALEHGLLELDSSIKQTEDGFYDYYIERSKRLRELTDGNIDIHLAFGSDEKSENHQITLAVTDSGKGFDVTQLNDNTPSNRLSGRGLALVRSLCDDVVYSNGGRTVTVRYTLKR